MMYPSDADKQLTVDAEESDLSPLPVYVLSTFIFVVDYICYNGLQKFFFVL